MIEQSFKCPKCHSKHTTRNDNKMILTFCRCCGTQMIEVKYRELTEWGN